MAQTSVRGTVAGDLCRFVSRTVAHQLGVAMNETTDQLKHTLRTSVDLR